jgi:hypothetical protein
MERHGIDLGLRCFLPRKSDTATSISNEMEMLIYPNLSTWALLSIQEKYVSSSKPRILEMEYPLSFSPPHILETRGKVIRPTTKRISHQIPIYANCTV